MQLPLEPPFAAEERRRRRRRTVLVTALVTPVVVAAIAGAVVVGGVLSAFAQLGHGIPGDRLLKPGQSPAPYPAALVTAYERSAVAQAGCPLLQGPARGTPTFSDQGGTFTVTYPRGLILLFGTDDGTTTSTPLPGRPWQGQLREIDGLTTLVDGACQVTVVAWLDRRATSDELALALRLRPVPGPAGALRPHPPVLTLAERLAPTLGGDGQPGTCGEADLDVAGARATPGCQDVFWPEYGTVGGSSLMLSVDRYATAADARYQFGIHHRYMRQYAGTSADAPLPGVPQSYLIVTNRGQQCEASFVEGRTVVTVGASAPYAGQVPPTAQAEVRADLATARAALHAWEAAGAAAPLA